MSRPDPSRCSADACRLGEAVRTADTLRRVAANLPRITPHEREIVRNYLEDCAEAVIRDA